MNIKIDGTPTGLSWRGADYQVKWYVRDAQPFVETQPANPELRDACLRNMRAHENHLTKMSEGGKDFLADDPQRGC